MPKGHTNNPHGRPIGSQNKVTKEVREKINRFIEHNLEKIQEIFDSLEPKERLKFIIDLLPYVIPKMQPLNESINEPQKIIVEGISTEELNELLGDN